MTDKKYKDLGCCNNWLLGYIPNEYLECSLKKHELTETKLNTAGTYKEYKCDICLIKFTEDSGD